jgi:hypothetical protein
MSTRRKTDYSNTVNAKDVMVLGVSGRLMTYHGDRDMSGYELVARMQEAERLIQLYNEALGNMSLLLERIEYGE